MAAAREDILDRLKSAVHPGPEAPDFDAPVYFSIDQPLDQAFKENLEKVNGSVYLCSSETELCKQLKILLHASEKENICCREGEIQTILKDACIPFSSCDSLSDRIEIGITSCEFLVAHTGSVMVSSAQEGGRQMNIFPPVHVVIARKDQLVDYLNAAYAAIQNKYGSKLPSQITLITGPSRTADIEKTLVMGAHGPRELHVLIYQ